jgi:hypothetical protein
MELMLAKKIEELSKTELTEVLRKLLMQDREAFNALKELVEDIV